MNLLFEQPTTLLLIGALAEAIAIGGLVKTGRKEMLLAVVGVPLLFAALLGLERYVVTDREAVRNAIHALAADVENNDLPAVLSHLSDQIPEAKKRAEAEFPRYTFDAVSVKSNLEIEVFEKNIPPKAVASFNVTVLVSDRGGMVSNAKVARFVEMTFYKENDRWKVGQYEHFDPIKRK